MNLNALIGGCIIAFVCAQIANSEIEKAYQSGYQAASASQCQVNQNYKTLGIKR